jgi:hypothetical protein
MNQASVRTLFQRASGAISMFDGRGKSNAVMPSITGAGYTDNGNSASLYHETRTGFNDPYLGGSFYILTGDAASNGNTNYRGYGSITITATGGGLSYEWQVANRYSGGVTQPVNGTVNAYVARVVNNTTGNSPYYDYVTGANTNTLSFSNIYPNYQNSTSGQSSTYVGGNQNVEPWYNRDYGPTTAYYRLKVSNSVGTVYSPWYGVTTRYDSYQSSLGMRGFNCSGCYYDCNCTCGWTTNCCCYDSNGDGITCCDVNNGDVNACCNRPDQCGEGYNCYDCSTCYNTCWDNCGSDPCNDNCGYYEEAFETVYSDSGLY